MNDLENLSLAQKSPVLLSSGHGDYVVELAVQSGIQNGLVAAGSTNGRIALLSHDTLKQTNTLSGHLHSVMGLQFGKSDPSVLFSSSADKTVREWDTRQKGDKAAQIFRAPNGFPFDLLCVDVSKSDKVVCAGSDFLSEDGQEAHILFWDRRKASLLGSYTESHTDSVSQVKFKPGSDKLLLSASSDGLVCVYDLKHQSEDDALQMTFNAESNVARAGWCGDNQSSIYAVTTDNALHLWDYDEDKDLCRLTDLELAAKTFPLPDTDNDESLYLVDCILGFDGSQEDLQGAVFVCGNKNGSGQVLQVDKDSQLRQLSRLVKGHCNVVRCTQWDAQSRNLVTAGEDSCVCLWTSSHDISGSASSKDKFKAKASPKKKFDQKSKKPYSRNS